MAVGAVRNGSVHQGDKGRRPPGEVPIPTPPANGQGRKGAKQAKQAAALIKSRG